MSSAAILIDALRVNVVLCHSNLDLPTLTSNVVLENLIKWWDIHGPSSVGDDLEWFDA